MRNLLSIPAVVLWATLSAEAAELSELDRQRLLAHLNMTSSWFLDEVSSLSRAQLEFRPAPGSWSIMEVIEHLVMVGGIYWDDLQRAMKAPASGRIVSNRDTDILWYGIDRTYREPAIASEIPPGQLRDLRAGLDTYRKHHARLVQYVRTTKDDLRARFVERQGSDAYQWALLISTHEQRHVLQIREIKANPKFPRN